MDDQDQVEYLKTLTEYCPRCKTEKRLTGKTKTTERDRVLGPTELVELECGHYTL